MTNTIDTAITANLAALAEGLREAATLATSAYAAMHADNRNLAVGTVLPLEQDLPTYVGLLTAILDGRHYVSAGLHYVNRIGYVRTEVAWTATDEPRAWRYD